MGRTKLFVNDTEDETSTDDESERSMDDFLVDSRRPYLRLQTRLRSNISAATEELGRQPGPSGISSSVQPRSAASRLAPISSRLRRRLAENRSSSSNTNSASNSPQQPGGPSSPKLPRLLSPRETGGNNSQRISSSTTNQRASALSNNTSPSPLNFFRRNQSRRPVVIESDDDESGATMNTGTAAGGGGDDEDSVHDVPHHRRATRLWPRSNTASRRPTATASAGDRRSRQQQIESDEAYARRLQAQFDAQVNAEQTQRRRQEVAAVRGRRRTPGNLYRPPTPPVPRMRDFVEFVGDDDDDDDDLHLPLALASILMERATSADGNSRDDHLRSTRNSQRRGSPSGPTTLATVRRYFREAHLDAELFPESNVSVLNFEAFLELADQLGDGAPSMSISEINRLPTRVYRQTNISMDGVETSSSASGSSNSTNYSDETPTCAICMEKFTDGDVQRNLPCFHAFHKDCVDVWLKQKSSCPVCRVDARRTSPTGSP